MLAQPSPMSAMSTPSPKISLYQSPSPVPVQQGMLKNLSNTIPKLDLPGRCEKVCTFLEPGLHLSRTWLIPPLNLAYTSPEPGLHLS